LTKHNSIYNIRKENAFIKFIFVCVFFLISPHVYLCFYQEQAVWLLPGVPALVLWLLLWETSPGAQAEHLHIHVSTNQLPVPSYLLCLQGNCQEKILIKALWSRVSVLLSGCSSTYYFNAFKYVWNFVFHLYFIHIDFFVKYIFIPNVYYKSMTLYKKIFTVHIMLYAFIDYSRYIHIEESNGCVYACLTCI